MKAPIQDIANVLPVQEFTEHDNAVAGLLDLELGPASPGWVWFLRRIAVYGNPPEDTVTGSCVLYRDSVTAFSVIDPLAITIPNGSEYGRGTVTVRSAKPLIAHFVDIVPATAELFCSFTVELFPEFLYPDLKLLKDAIQKRLEGEPDVELEAQAKIAVGVNK